MYNLPPHAGEVMYLFGFPDGADASSDLRFWWRTDHDPMTLYALCSDTFAWATADLEPIEEEDMPLLRQCFEDLQEHDETMYLPELFAARKRKMRPMRLWLGTHPSQGDPELPKWKRGLIGDAPDLLLMFLAAGPERDPQSEG